MSDRICSHPPCERPVHAKGLCSAHRAQQARGVPLGPIRPARRSLRERFFEKVAKPEGESGCWMWVGAMNHLGYGQIWLSEDKRVIMAHRASLMLAGIPLPDDCDVDHLCRVPSCVNPAHLEPVTHAVNMERAPWSARDFQSAKTHCNSGHEFTPENTHTKRNASGGVSRECRACRRDAQARYRARRVAARQA